MKFYIASRLTERPQLVHIAASLRELGHSVTAKWIYDSGDAAKDDVMATKIAIRDLCNIAEADVFLLDTITQVAQDGGAGKETEFGFSLGYYQDKQMWRIGPIKNVFHAMADKSVETWDLLLSYLRSHSSPNTAAYYAGFLDGEGYFTLAIVNKGTYDNIIPLISASQVNKLPLTLLQTSYGGTVLPVKARNSKHRDAWRWTIASRSKVKACLKDIYPFLTVKKQQAELLLEFLSRPAFPGGRNSDLYIPKEEKSKRMSLYKSMRMLNKRGRRNET